MSGGLPPPPAMEPQEIPPPPPSQGLPPPVDDDILRESVITTDDIDIFDEDDDDEYQSGLHEPMATMQIHGSGSEIQCMTSLPPLAENESCENIIVQPGSIAAQTMAELGISASVPDAIQESDEEWSTDEEKEDSSSDDDDHLEVYRGRMSMAVPSHVITRLQSTEEEKSAAEHESVHEPFPVSDDDVDTYWVIGSEQDKKYSLMNWAEQHFQIHKHKKSFFKEFSIAELLEWVPYNKLSNALNQLDKKLNKQAKQTWKNINSYMNDRKSSKGPLGHVMKLLEFATNSPQLRDEIYCQLCKQTNHNPKQDSLYRGWKLMCIFCSIFEPTTQFAPYLATYLYNNAKHSSSEVSESATFALKALDFSIKYGNRERLPDKAEIESIEKRELIEVKIHYMDLTFESILLSSQTRVSYLETTIAYLLRLRYPGSFGLFEMETPEDPDWEIMAYSKRKRMNMQKKIADLHRMPLDRPLEDHECVMDVVSSWTERKHKIDKRNHDISLVYRCKIFSKVQEESYTHMDRYLSYTTAVWNVISGYYPVSEKYAIQLAAIQLHAKHGEHPKSYFVPGILADVLHDYLPHLYRSRYSHQKAEGLILAQHSHYLVFDKNESILKYLSTLRKEASLHYYGLSFFRCVLRTKTKLCTEFDLIVGIGEKGIIFLNALTKQIIHSFEVATIQSYGCRSKIFVFVSGGIMNQKKFQLSTPKAKEMNALLKSYIDLKSEANYPTR